MSEVTAIGWVPRDDNLPTRLAMLRQAMGWNVKEAASECGISVQSWRNWEAGGHCRDQEGVARKISARTGVSYLWVFAGIAEGSPSPSPATSGSRGDDMLSTRRNFAGERGAVLIRAQFGASRPAVVASATTADRERISA